MFVFFASSPYRVYYVWSVSSSVLPLSSSRIFAGVLEQCRPLLQEAAVLECMGVERRKKICSEQPDIMLGPRYVVRRTDYSFSLRESFPCAPVGMNLMRVRQHMTQTQNPHAAGSTGRGSIRPGCASLMMNRLRTIDDARFLVEEIRKLRMMRDKAWQLRGVGLYLFVGGSVIKQPIRLEFS
ncbi:hypothetical protein FVEG_14732 [Fusarium verticillioides 7600]|uniref:Uncharacterized protein n=1 Tax=Gibberella moniliformis (strain M3125 / FGSC 7600) TaxID=334819 RepID=W7LBQ6_GIBM7|nr:hypothetical protein FVEG_14732 [Fusarium verticillioides 7600]EWG36963.1 hypothetical protein FVEG_14732 [Fusarium verticillioides 7600]